MCVCKWGSAGLVYPTLQVLVDSLCVEGDAAPIPDSCSTGDIQAAETECFGEPSKAAAVPLPRALSCWISGMLRWLGTLTASPAVPGSGRSSAVITSQGTQYWPGKGWLLPNALTLQFNQGGNHLCGTVTKLNILSIHTILRLHLSPKRDNPAL